MYNLTRTRGIGPEITAGRTEVYCSLSILRLVALWVRVLLLVEFSVPEISSKMMMLLRAH